MMPSFLLNFQNTMKQYQLLHFRTVECAILGWLFYLNYLEPSSISFKKNWPQNVTVFANF
uniref:Uncharacterized protein n=1 Tax=Arundo donax TaxID=35708 RepID=A0A0A9A1Z0_ARUDO